MTNIYCTLASHFISLRPHETDILTFCRYQSIKFFTDWYLAYECAILEVAFVNPSLITFVDTDKTSNFILGDMLNAFSASFAFLSVPGISALTFGIEETTANAPKALVTALLQALGASRAIWPTGITSSRVLQFGDLAGTLGSIDTDVSDMVNGDLEVLMTNVLSFVSFASTGAWSGGNAFHCPTL